MKYRFFYMMEQLSLDIPNDVLDKVLLLFQIEFDCI